MMAAMPVVEPSAAMLKVVPGCCALNSSASCGTNFAPSVSDPLMTSVSARTTEIATLRAIKLRKSFFIKVCLSIEFLLDRDETDLGDDFLTSRPDRVIEELLGQAARLAVCIVKRRPPISVRVVLH